MTQRLRRKPRLPHIGKSTINGSGDPKYRPEKYWLSESEPGPAPVLQTPAACELECSARSVRFPWPSLSFWRPFSFRRTFRRSTRITDSTSHFYLTNYIQEGTPIREFLKIMGKTTGRSVLFGIPLHQFRSDQPVSGPVSVWHRLRRAKRPDGIS